MNRGVNDWFALFTTWLQQTFPAATVVSKNGYVPATTAEYASMCLVRGCCLILLVNVSVRQCFWRGDSSLAACLLCYTMRQLMPIQHVVKQAYYHSCVLAIPFALSTLPPPLLGEVC